MGIPAIAERLQGLVLRRKSREGVDAPPDRADEKPLRAELYSVDQLERHAKLLAASHQISTSRTTDQLIPRLNENERILIHAHDVVTAAVKLNRSVAPAAEWLLDNFYLIEEQIRTARRHLPRSYSRELPCLANGPAAGFPRAYGIALELIAHGDGRLDAVSLNGFIASYQTITPLKLGELWAVPIMMRLALIENLRRVATRITAGRKDRDLAHDWTERMVQVVEQNPTDLILVMADMARANPPLSGAFLAEMTRHLQGQSRYFTFVNNWLENRLAEQGFTVEQLVRADGQEQAADQVSMGNSINSLRFLSSNDWREFVENHSSVEHILREEPAGVYPNMDFATRDRYRHEVETIAKRTRLSESDVARKAVQLSRAQIGQARFDDRAAHVGYYLIDRGRGTLERSVAMRSSLGIRVARIGRRFPLFFYLAAILPLAGALTATFLAVSAQFGASALFLGVIALPAAMCALHLSIGVVNLLATLLVHPRPLPRLDFREGVPPEHRAIVVVPTMLSNPDMVADLLEGLEVRYLANRDANLHFALLTDLEDAPQESLPGDDGLVRQAQEGIELLNRKYEAHRTDIFYLFHRPRRWNAQEGLWMGYERKRGKLAEFNALLRGKPAQFAQVVGDTTILPQVRYVITLDTDTQLPRDTAREMAGAMAHVLNRPVIDSTQRRVVSGYGILQPRVGVCLPSARRSWFVRLFGGDPGVDPYTRVVSDLYQDLFGEGSFIGKGIYDVDAFTQCCDNFPENTVLSHDLLESAYARSGLLSDVELYEDYPSRYPTDVSRRHRWIRGDWQIIGWLLPRVPGPGGRRVKNTIAALSWWKIFDNLRRSLAPAAAVILLLGCWLATASPVGMLATFFVLAAAGAVPLLVVLADLVRKSPDLPLAIHLRVVVGTLGKQATQYLFGLTFLPYEAYTSLDAIVRTLMRTLWTRHRLLEWKTFTAAHRDARTDLPSFLRSMWIGPAIAAATIGFLFAFQSALIPFAGPLLGLWFVSPGVAWWLSRSLPVPAPRLSDMQRQFLEKLSRRTWRYFEDLVTAEENWLPPDNLQEGPVRGIASRTSPTNIGVALLANLAAYDFGYCSAGQMLDRMLKTFDSLGRMERYRGHFYNWYETRTLKPLQPRYVSTVDSGNLAGHLMVLRSGLLELTDARALPPRFFGGLCDTVRVLLDVARGLKPTQEENSGPLVPPDLLRRIERLEEDLKNPPETASAAAALMQRLPIAASAIASAIGANRELQWWARTVERSCAEHRDDFLRVAAWSILSPPPPRTWEQRSPEQGRRVDDLRQLLAKLEAVPTLREIAGLQKSMLPAIDAVIADCSGPTAAGAGDQAGPLAWFKQLRLSIVESSQRAAERIRALERTARQCQEFADIDFTFLFDRQRDLFAIGYNVGDNRLDASFYDLLASEARLASFLAIAQCQIDQKHWFALGRLLTTTGGAPALLSWSGSMFEYLMPLLVMPTYENTILDHTYRAVVRRQIKYGKQRGVPWGISESGYNTIDAHMNYQYRAFGVPGLGLKRGLAEDLVIAPYASVLALMVAPEAACRNLERLTAEGRQGPYGFYEAVDYTPARVPRGTTGVTVQQFMAHHEGMSLLALAYLLRDKPMQRRFEADLALHAADVLLQERIPKAAAPVFPHVAEARETRVVSAEEEGTMRVFTNPSTLVPEVHLLSNGRYHVAVTSAGGGYSRWRDLAVTRWREDPTRDCWGSFCYLRDVESGSFWSTAFQPTLKPSRRYQAIFTQARAEFRRRDERIDSHTEISVSPEDDVEVRRITLTNRSDSTRTVEVTSYAEVVLALPAHDLSHPAFSNLFVQTELAPQRQAVICTRRPRSAEERPPWMVNLMTVRGTTVGDTSFETDRMKFIGRGRTLATPAAMDRNSRLSNSDGPVLDPVVSIRRVVSVEPNETVQIDIVTGVGESREVVTALMDKYHDNRLADRVFELAWTHSQILLRQLNIAEADAQVYGRLAGSILYASARSRSRSEHLDPQPAWAIRPVGIRHFGRPADRTRTRSRSHEDRYGPPGGAGTCLLAPERPECRSGDLERGRLGLPPDPSRHHHGPGRRRRGSSAGRQARRHFRPPRRANVGGGPRPAADGSAGGFARRCRHARGTGRTARPGRRVDSRIAVVAPLARTPAPRSAAVSGPGVL